MTASAQPELWTIRILSPMALLDTLEEAFAAQALAVSILPVAQDNLATLELLVDGKPDDTKIQAALAACHAPDLKWESVAVGNLDWIKKVSGDFPPLPIARWTIFGAMHKDKVKDHTLALQIDATSAFGTGEHPTTRGCLVFLDELLTREEDAQAWRMLDMGCGSGILAMAFAKATSGQALGVDMDGPSVEIARENLAVNGLTTRVRFECSEGYSLPLVTQNGPYDLIMANIFAQPLCDMAANLKNHLKPGGWAILSGLLITQEDAVVASHQAQGLSLEKIMHDGEWSVLALRRPSIAS